MFTQKRNRWWKIFFVTLILIVVGGILWSRFFQPEPVPETVTVTRGDIQETLSLSGSLEPSLFADLGFAGSGRIISVAVASGDTVKKGQILMTLEDPVAQAQYQQSMVAVRIAEEQEKLARRDWDSLKKEEKAATKLATDEARAGKTVVGAQFVSNQVRAPFNGVITRLDARPGEIVTAGRIVARAAGSAATQVIRVNVSESEVVKLRDQIGADVTFDALDDTIFHARLTSLSQSSITDQDVVSYEAIFTLLDGDARLRDGMTADLEVVAEEQKGVLMLPARAVKKRDTGFFVEVYDELTKTTTQSAVERGLEGDDGMVEISGVAEGIQVVVNKESKD